MESGCCEQPERALILANVNTAQRVVPGVVMDEGVKNVSTINTRLNIYDRDKKAAVLAP